MGRPREHDLDKLLDHARKLWVEGGMSGVTIRALSAASGASNGAIYNAFGSRDNLLARVWTREAERFLALQTETVEAALATGDAPAAVVAAALAPSHYHQREPAGAKLLLAVSLDDLAVTDLGETEKKQLRQLRRGLGNLITRLAGAVWNETDDRAVTLITFCVVDLPSALLLAGDRITDPLAREALTRSVLGIITPASPTPLT